MKTDRLLELLYYLVNHGRISTTALARRFGVSARTIQRDMVCLSEAGVPVYAQTGRNGGYAILPTDRVRNAHLKQDEQQMIRRALEGLATAYRSPTLDALLEKYAAIVRQEGGSPVYWDFGVTRENLRVQDSNAFLEEAVRNGRQIAFAYRDGQGRKTSRRVQPLALEYRWYAWYLFAYDLGKADYRTFKVARLREIKDAGPAPLLDHGDVRAKMEKALREYVSGCADIELRFSASQEALVEEYFPDCPIETLPDGERRTWLRVPEGERLWQALLLSFGGRIQVLGPKEYVDALKTCAAGFLRAHRDEQEQG